MQRQKAQRTFTYTLLTALLTMTMTGCVAKCGSGSSTAGSKADYIQTLDGICTKAADAGKDIPAIYAQMNEATDPVEKMRLSHVANEKGYTVVDSMTREMEKVPQPAEDAAALKEIWANQKKSVELLSGISSTSKKMAEAGAQPLAPAAEHDGEEGEEGEEAHAEEAPATNPDMVAHTQALQDLSAQLGALSETMSAQAKKYGFKVCFNPK